jgi:hypothetical protein
LYPNYRTANYFHSTSKKDLASIFNFFHKKKQKQADNQPVVFFFVALVTLNRYYPIKNKGNYSRLGVICAEPAPSRLQLIFIVG